MNPEFSMLTRERQLLINDIDAGNDCVKIYVEIDLTDRSSV